MIGNGIAVGVGSLDLVGERPVIADREEGIVGGDLGATVGSGKRRYLNIADHRIADRAGAGRAGATRRAPDGYQLQGIGGVQLVGQAQIDGAIGAAAVGGGGQKAKGIIVERNIDVVVISGAAGWDRQIDAGIDDAGHVDKGIELEIDVEFDRVRVFEIGNVEIIDIRGLVAVDGDPV